MAEKTFNQDFVGFWREPNKGGIPDKSGIYCVYECTYNKNEGNVTLHELIYIGESKDVRDRISKHEKQEDWEKHVRVGKQLCYSFTPVESAYRDRVEAAFIYHHKPPENTDYVSNFPFDKTLVKSSGRIGLLKDYFVANRT